MRTISAVPIMLVESLLSCGTLPASEHDLAAGYDPLQGRRICASHGNGTIEITPSARVAAEPGDTKVADVG